MAVRVDFEVPGATPEQMYAVEARTQERGQAAGGPPYAGCMAIVVTAGVDAFRFVSVWRTEEAFRAVVDTMLGPDLAEHGLAVDRVTVEPVVSMGIPGSEA